MAPPNSRAYRLAGSRRSTRLEKKTENEEKAMVAAAIEASKRPKLLTEAERKARKEAYTKDNAILMNLLQQDASMLKIGGDTNKIEPDQPRADLKVEGDEKDIMDRDGDLNVQEQQQEEELEREPEPEEFDDGEREDPVRDGYLEWAIIEKDREIELKESELHQLELQKTILRAEVADRKRLTDSVKANRIAYMNPALGADKKLKAHKGLWNDYNAAKRKGYGRDTGTFTGESSSLQGDRDVNME